MREGTKISLVEQGERDREETGTGLELWESRPGSWTVAVTSQGQGKEGITGPVRLLDSVGGGRVRARLAVRGWRPHRSGGTKGAINFLGLGQHRAASLDTAEELRTGWGRNMGMEEGALGTG